jgi:hypothetical protein
MLDCGNRRCRGVVNVDEGPDAAAVTDDRQPALAHQRDDVAVDGEPGARPVEIGIAQGDPFDAGSTGDRVFEVADRRERLPLLSRRVRVERIGFGLQAAAGALVAPVALALGDDASGAGSPRGLQEVVSALRAQTVGESHPRGSDRGHCSSQ